MRDEVNYAECAFCDTLIFCGEGNPALRDGPSCPCGGRHWLCNQCNMEWDLFDPETAGWRMCPLSAEIQLATDIMEAERPERDPLPGDLRL